MDHQRASCKVPESLYQVFKVALSLYEEWITKEQVVKFPSLYIKCLNLRCTMYQEWISKEKVVNLQSLYIKCLKLRFLCMKSGSPKTKL